MTEEEFKEFYDKCVEYYQCVEDISSDVNIDIDTVDHIFETLLCDNFMIMYEENNEVIEGVRFYENIFNKIKLVTNYKELHDLVEFYLFENKDSIHLRSYYNIVGYCMKIVTHLIWSLCYELSPRWRQTPEEALNDIVDPIKTSQNELKIIIHNIEQKRLLNIS